MLYTFYKVHNQPKITILSLKIYVQWQYFVPLQEILFLTVYGASVEVVVDVHVLT